MRTVYILAPDRKAFELYANTTRRYLRDPVNITYLEIYEDAENVVFEPNDKLYATKHYWLNFDHYEIMLRLKKNNPTYDFGDIY